MKKIFISIFSLLLFFSCKDQPKENSSSTKKSEQIVEQKEKIQLKKVWETDTVLKTAESVLYDEAKHRLLVSNGNKNGWEMDGDGFIAEIDFEGNIKELKLIEGLSSPKGMALLGDKLYVADSKEIAKIDLKTKKILKRYSAEVEDPQFNDVVAKNGVIYISASNAKSIYKIENDSLLLAHKGSLSRPNGLLFRNDSLFVMNSKSENLKVISQNEKLKTLTKDLGAGDGITPLDGTSFIVSDWKGRLFYIDKNFQKKLLLDTRKENLNSADILYLEEKNLLLVPTFHGNMLAAYQLNN